MKWISVTESLPEPIGQFHMVIVATDKGVGFAYFDRINGFGSIALNGNMQHYPLEVTHWIPLPPAPAE